MAVANDRALAQHCRAATRTLTPEVMATASPVCRGLMWLLARRLDERMARRSSPSPGGSVATMAARLARVALDDNVDLLGALTRAFSKKAVFFNVMLEHAAAEPHALPIVAAWAARGFLAKPPPSRQGMPAPAALAPDYLRLAGRAFMKEASDAAATRLLQPDWSASICTQSGLSPSDLAACWVMMLSLGWPAIGMHYADDMLPGTRPETAMWPYRRLAQWMAAGGCDLPKFDPAAINQTALQCAVAAMPQTILTPYALGRSLRAALATAMMGAHKHWLAKPTASRPRPRA